MFLRIIAIVDEVPWGNVSNDEHFFCFFIELGCLINKIYVFYLIYVDGSRIE
jgi:hypothetical protein